MYQTKNLGLNITEIEKDKLQPFNFDTDLGRNFKAIDEKTLSHRNITNCLLEVPQDIKLELVDGVLTLKEGSKVYIPNGFEADGVTKKFDEVVIQNDISFAKQTNNHTWILCYNANNNSDNARTVTNSFSGNTPTLTDSNYLAWYDTANNFMKFSSDRGVSWNSGFSLPLCICTSSNNAGFSSIDQVFNGFGYVGSTLFALPGVKGLVPNGRNEDGSLNNITITLDSVKTHTTNFHFNLQNTFWLRSHGDLTQGRSDYWVKGSHETTPTIEDGYLYDANTNMYYHCAIGNSKWEPDISYIALAEGFVETDGKITSLTPKKPFRAVDYNDYQTKITELETKIATLQAAVEALQG